MLFHHLHFLELILGLSNLYYAVRKPFTKGDHGFDGNRILLLILLINIVIIFSWKLESQQKRNISEAADLREKIKSLWIKLEVDEAERQAFLTKNVGYKPSIITKVGNNQVDSKIDNNSVHKVPFSF